MWLDLSKTFRLFLKRCKCVGRSWEGAICSCLARAAGGVCGPMHEVVHENNIVTYLSHTRMLELQ